MSDKSFQDVPLINHIFTWNKGSSKSIMARLDRFIISNSFCVGIPLSLDQKVIEGSLSDHFSILLSLYEGNKSSSVRRFKAFKYKNWWLEILGLSDSVLEAWSSSSVLASTSRPFKAFN